VKSIAFGFVIGSIELGRDGLKRLPPEHRQLAESANRLHSFTSSPPFRDARTIARMPARTASERCGQEFRTSAASDDID
jgi:hypothetical protein